jgi:hypothetical protein
MKRIDFPFLSLLLLLAGCVQAAPTHSTVDRLASIPATVVKGTPQNDLHPPVASQGWSQPIPLEGPIDTAGAEDSPFMPTDGQTLYFFFTPDANIPVQNQVGDGVTGIWMSPWDGSGWGEPTRVWLTKGNELSMDGCEFVLGDTMWFCSIRSGNLNEIDWYVAHRVNGVWSNWQNAGIPINGDYQVGEMHITADGKELYFASQRPGGFDGFDLWVSEKAEEGWGEPTNLGANVNTASDENRPYVTVDGSELWYDSNYAVYRCLRQVDGSWAGCSRIISPLAGEPTLSPDGKSLYFVHHFLTSDSKIIEADIYVSQRIP